MLSRILIQFNLALITKGVIYVGHKARPLGTIGLWKDEDKIAICNLQQNIPPECFHSPQCRKNMVLGSRHIYPCQIP